MNVDFLNVDQNLYHSDFFNELKEGSEREVKVLYLSFWFEASGRHKSV